MDAAMNEPEMKKFFDDNFVVRHLVVMEAETKKNLENPGAADMMNPRNRRTCHKSRSAGMGLYRLE